MASSNVISEHFERLIYEPDTRSPVTEIQLPLTFEQWHMNSPWTLEEIQGIINGLPNGKSCGLDGIYYEQWRASSKDIAPIITVLFNKIMQEGHIPTSWHNTSLSLLFKGRPGDPKDDMDFFRGIASEATLKKIFFKGVIRRIERVIYKLLPPEQFGFRRGI